MEKRLPVLATLVSAILLCRHHGRFALKIIAPWFVILLAAPHLLVGVLGGDQTQATTAGPQPWQLVFGLLYVVGWGSIAVLWHSRILRDDHQGQAMVTLDGRVWSYLVRGLLIVIIIAGVSFLSAIPVIMAGMLVGSSIQSLAFYAVLAAPPIVISFVVGSRLSVALPAVALGVSEFGLNRAWTATRNNGLRLLMVTALPLLPLLALPWLFPAAGMGGTGPDGSMLPPLWPRLGSQILDFAFGLLGLTVLSLTYAFFAMNRSVGGNPQ